MILGGVQGQPEAGPGRREEGAVRLVSAELLVRHHALRPDRRRPRPTWAAPGASTASRARATRCRRGTRSTASWRGASRPSSGRTRPQPVPPELRGTTTAGLRLGTLFTFDTALHEPLWPVEQPRPVRAAGAGAELREHPLAVRGVHRPLDQPADAGHGHDLLAGETRGGRVCCGRCTTTTATRPAASSARRRPMSRCTSCTRYDDGGGHDRQPGRRQAGRPDRASRRCTAPTATCWTASARPATCPGQSAGQHGRAQAEDAGGHHAAGQAQDVFRRAVAAQGKRQRRRPQRVLAVHRSRTSSTGRPATATRRRP